MSASIPPTTVALLVCGLLIAALAALVAGLAPARPKAARAPSPGVLDGIGGGRVAVGLSLIHI